MLKIDGHDDAVLGSASVWVGEERVEVLVYSGEKICQALVEDGMTWEEAQEYVAHNIECAYMGPYTPVLVWEYSLGEEE